jgi:hypothetical protein
MLKRILIISLSIFFIHCEKKPDEKNESTLKDKDGNVSEYAVNFTRLSTVYKKKMADDIEYFYNKKFNSKDFSGGFLVAKNGEILYENYSGFAYKEKRDSIKKDTPIHLASVSKVITAVTVLKLIDQDKIELDEKWYYDGNEILSKLFIQRYLMHQCQPYVFTDNYLVNIIDSDVNQITLNKNQYILLKPDEYKIVTFGNEHDEE